MISQENTAIIIPARLDSKRLPNKPLLEIDGIPMIQHVWKRAVESTIGQVIVATDSSEIQKTIENVNGYACLTSKEHESGTDRVLEAINSFDPEKKFQYIINLQGDLPTINTDSLNTVVHLLEGNDTDIGTLATPFKDKNEMKKEQFVKAVCGNQKNLNTFFAEDFARNSGTFDEDNLYHHIGIYSFTRNSLEKFVSLPMSLREKNEKLEQLRALDNNMKIKVGVIDFLPIGIDTPEDLENIKLTFK